MQSGALACSLLSRCARPTAQPLRQLHSSPLEARLRQDHVEGCANVGSSQAPLWADCQPKASMHSFHHIVELVGNQGNANQGHSMKGCLHAHITIL